MDTNGQCNSDSDDGSAGVWQSRYRFDTTDFSIEACRTSSPRAISMRDQYLASLGISSSTSTAIPSDAIVWRKGNDCPRTTTRIGGAPFLPKYIPWPKDGNGREMLFLAQFDFSRSTDLFGTPLPGSLLLIFVQVEFLEGIWEDQASYLWLTPDNADITMSQQIPEQQLPALFWGEPHRTFDANSEAIVAEVARDLAVRDGVMPASEMDDYIRPYARELCRWRGVKIGGVPLITYERDELTEDFVYNELGGVFICGLREVYPSLGPWPWANIRNPIEVNPSNAHRECFGFRDGFDLYMALNEQGETRGTFILR